MVKDPTPEVSPVHPQHQPEASSNTDVLGIISLVCAFIGFHLPGLVVGIIGVKKAKEEGRSTTLSKVGWIINLVFMIITIIVASFFLVAIISTSNKTSKVIDRVSDYKQAQQDEYNAAKAGEKDFSKGETGKFGVLEVKVTNVTRNYVPTNDFDRASTGKELVVLDLSVKNTGAESKYVSDYDFKLEENGLQQSADFASPPGKKFDNGQLAAGATTTGQLVYEVTANASNLKLVDEVTIYNPTNYGAEKVTYTLAV